jgi:hypothetical protein
MMIPDFFINRPIRNTRGYFSVASIKREKVPTKCAMCGKMAIISDEHDNNNKNEKERQQVQEVETSNIIMEQIDGTYYIFDTTDCVLMFKKFSALYGSNFADE